MWCSQGLCWEGKGCVVWSRVVVGMCSEPVVGYRCIMAQKCFLSGIQHSHKCADVAMVK